MRCPRRERAGGAGRGHLAQRPRQRIRVASQAYRRRVGQILAASPDQRQQRGQQEHADDAGEKPGHRQWAGQRHPEPFAHRQGGRCLAARRLVACRCRRVGRRSEGIRELRQQFARARLRRAQCCAREREQAAGGGAIAERRRHARQHSEQRHDGGHAATVAQITVGDAGDQVRGDTLHLVAIECCEQAARDDQSRGPIRCAQRHGVQRRTLRDQHARSRNRGRDRHFGDDVCKASFGQLRDEGSAHEHCRLVQFVSAAQRSPQRQHHERQQCEARQRGPAGEPDPAPHRQFFRGVDGRSQFVEQLPEQIRRRHGQVDEVHRQTDDRVKQRRHQCRGHESDCGRADQADRRDLPRSAAIACDRSKEALTLRG